MSAERGRRPTSIERDAASWGPFLAAVAAHARPPSYPAVSPGLFVDAFFSCWLFQSALASCLAVWGGSPPSVTEARGVLHGLLST